MMIVIDGSYGEGGGQILRSALALSLATKTPFRIEKIRAGRKQPGLLRQHLTSVNAAAEIGQAEVSGATMGSQALSFTPGEVKHGEHHFAIGTAGSTALVLQTVLPALLIASPLSGQTTTIRLEGGTHNPFAPPFDFLDRTFLPILRRMGAFIDARIIRHGFYPAGGGEIEITIHATNRLEPIELTVRGKIRARHARAVVAHLPRKIAEREISVLQKKLSWPDKAFQIVKIDDSQSPGNFIAIEIESEAVRETFTAFGERGLASEEVAEDAIKQTRRYLAGEMVAGEYLSDQLLLPMALAGGGVFTAPPPSRHTTTNIEIIKKFLDVEITTTPGEGRVHRIEVSS
jgi:RNA 3'-terminal phosphate cyclase (ATP)